MGCCAYGRAWRSRTRWGCVQLLLRNTPWWLLVLVVATCLDWEQMEWDWGLQGLALAWGLHGGNGCLWGGSEVPLLGLAEEAVCGAVLSRFPSSQVGSFWGQAWPCWGLLPPCKGPWGRHGWARPSWVTPAWDIHPCLCRSPRTGYLGWAGVTVTTCEGHNSGLVGCCSTQGQGSFVSLSFFVMLLQIMTSKASMYIRSLTCVRFLRYYQQATHQMAARS